MANGSKFLQKLFCIISTPLIYKHLVWVTMNYSAVSICHVYPSLLAIKKTIINLQIFFLQFYIVDFWYNCFYAKICSLLCSVLLNSFSKHHFTTLIACFYFIYPVSASVFKICKTSNAIISGHL